MGLKQVGLEKYSNYVSSSWVPPSGGEYFTRENPATSDILAELPKSTAADVGGAVDSAYDAFEKSDWSTRRPSERAKTMLKVVQMIRESADDLSRMLTLEQGRPLRYSKEEVLAAADVFEYFAGLARLIFGKTYQNSSDIYSVTNKEPIGVCAIITPWNFPLAQPSWKIAPALAAGCTVVVKPASYTTATTLELFKILDKVREFPKGVVNCVSGPGATVGQQLITHKKISKIAFTGSTESGKMVMEAASRGMKRVSLELGGKCASIIFGDANLQKAVVGAVWGAFRNCGQVCTAESRLLVQDRIYDDFVKVLADTTLRLKVGNGLEPGTNLGPLISRQQLDKSLEYVDIGRQEGAKLLCGGKRPSDQSLASGYFMLPTIFADANEHMRIAQEEIFAPLLTVMKFSSEEEAISIANGTPFGLASAVWTNDLNTAQRVTRSLKCGTIWVNTYHPIYPEMPFGGYKESGQGRELGVEGLEMYLETKHINYDMRPSAPAWN